MATLPAAIPTNSELTAEAKPVLSEFANELSRIQARPFSYARRQAAEDLMTRTGKWVKAWHAKTEPLRKAAHKAWTEACKLDSDMAKPVETVNKGCRGIVANYDLEEARRKAIEDAEKLRIATEEAQKLRDVKMAALVAEAAATGDEQLLQEAIEDEARPLTVVVDTAPAEKISDNSTTRFEVVGTITDLPALLRWIMGVSVEGLTNLLIDVSDNDDRKIEGLRKSAEIFFDSCRTEIHRELFGDPSISGMKALLKRMCTVDKDGQVHGEPPGIKVWRKSIVIDRG